MRIRIATSALVALGATSACILAGGLIHAETRDTPRPSESELLSSTWSVEASTDYGDTWNAPISSAGGQFPVRVDTSQLRSRAAYQPLSVRATTGSLSSATVTVGTGALLSGEPATASSLRVRIVVSRDGTCAAPAFSGNNLSLLAGNGSAAVPANTAASRTPVQVPGATVTTPGAPQTVCLELSMDPGSTAPDGLLTLSWPITVTRSE